MSLNSTYARKSPFLLKYICLYICFFNNGKSSKNFFVSDCATLQSCKTQAVKKILFLNYFVES